MFQQLELKISKVTLLSHCLKFAEVKTTNQWRKKMKYFRYVMMIFFLSFCICTLLNVQSTPGEDQLKTAEQVVTEIYNLVSFKAGETPDWEKVKSLFIDDAVVVLRTSFTQHSIFSREGFIDDFKNFIVKFRADTTGFTEKIVNIKTTVIGDIAHCFVVYDASIPTRKRPPQRGVDSFQLIKKDGNWRIVSIVNEIPTPNRPMPEDLLK